MIAWAHVKAIRVFIESVLRYGLPPDFECVLIEPKDGHMMNIRKALVPCTKICLQTRTVCLVVGAVITMVGTTTIITFFRMLVWRCRIKMFVSGWIGLAGALALIGKSSV